MSIHIKNIQIGDKVVFKDGSVGVVESVMSETMDALPPHGERIEARFNIKRSYGSSYHTYRRDGVCHHCIDGDIVAILPAETSADEKHKFSGRFMAALMGANIEIDKVPENIHFHARPEPMGDPYILRDTMENPPKVGKMGLSGRKDHSPNATIERMNERFIKNMAQIKRTARPITEISVSEYKSLKMKKEKSTAWAGKNQRRSIMPSVKDGMSF